MMKQTHLETDDPNVILATRKYVDDAISQVVTPGTLRFFASSAVPNGYLACNGEAVSRSTYAKLFEAIGTCFGEGDGKTTFNLPDCRGEFIRGWDAERGVDKDRQIGSYQTDAIQSHSHSGLTDSDGEHDHQGQTDQQGAHQHQGTTSWNGDHTHDFIVPYHEPGSGGFVALRPSIPAYFQTSSAGGHNHTFDTTSNGEHSHQVDISKAGEHTHHFNTSEVGEVETRPRNIAMLICIKY